MHDLRVVGLTLGNVQAQGTDAHIKYGEFFRALGMRTQLVDAVDVELRGGRRAMNLLHTFRLPVSAWREASYKNLRAFAWRSAFAQRTVTRMGRSVDVVLQHGALFSSATKAGPPVVIYTDFTFCLGERDDPWRTPLSGLQRNRWIEAEQAAYDSAAFILSRSDYARRSLIEDYAVPPDRVVTVGGGVNFPWDMEPSPLTGLRILFVGRVFERKGGRDVLRAFERVKRRVPGAELVLVTPHRAPSRVDVRYVTERLDRAAMSALYRSASVFVMPSYSETWGDSLLEAMAHGVPCVSSRRDAIPEIIRSGETGLLVEPGDVPALATALEWLLRDEQARRTVGDRGRAHVMTGFLWDQVAERITPHLRRAAQASSGAAAGAR
jgi:glycosyltransferase involved in cell wall biosynthesis